MSRKPRAKKPSHPRLEAEGWNDKEPTEVIDLAIERVKRDAERNAAKLRASRERLSKTSRDVGVDLNEVLRAYVGGSEPPPAAASH
jgi:hypothetical protein